MSPHEEWYHDDACDEAQVETEQAVRVESEPAGAAACTQRSLRLIVYQPRHLNASSTGIASGASLYRLANGRETRASACEAAHEVALVRGTGQQCPLWSRSRCSRNIAVTAVYGL